jgi:hypothetical protein
MTTWDDLEEMRRLRAELATLRANHEDLRHNCSRLNEANERLRAALIQVREVCRDNAAASCNQAMALKFVDSVAREALGK